MRVEARAPRGFGTTERIWRLTLTATTLEEEQGLVVLERALAQGGKIECILGMEEEEEEAHGPDH